MRLKQYLHSAAKFYTMVSSRNGGISWAASLLLVMMLLVLPLRWVIAFLLAVLIHECGHWIVIYIFTRQKPTLRFGSGGAVLYTDQLSLWQEAAASAAGPIASFALLLLRQKFPEMAVCALFHGIYNLLPIYPLDGGRVLRCLLQSFMDEKCVLLFCAVFEVIVWVVLFFAAFYACFVLRFGSAAVLAVGIMLVRLKKNTLQRSVRGGTIAIP